MICAFRSLLVLVAFAAGACSSRSPSADAQGDTADEQDVEDGVPIVVDDTRDQAIVEGDTVDDEPARDDAADEGTAGEDAADEESDDGGSSHNPADAGAPDEPIAEHDASQNGNPGGRTLVPSAPTPDAAEFVEQLPIVEVVVTLPGGVTDSFSLESAFASATISDAETERFELPVLGGAIAMLVVTDETRDPLYFALVPSDAYDQPVQVDATSTAVSLMVLHPLLSPLLDGDAASELLAAVERVPAVQILADEIDQAAESRGVAWLESQNVVDALPAALDGAIDAAGEALGYSPELSYTLGPNQAQSGVTIRTYRDEEFGVDDPAEMGIVVTNSYQRFIDARFSGSCGIPGTDAGPSALYEDRTMDACRRDGNDGAVAHDCVVSICRVEGEQHTGSVDVYGCGVLGEWAPEAMYSTVMTVMLEVTLPTVSALVGRKPGAACTWTDAVGEFTDWKAALNTLASDSSLINLAAQGDITELFGELTVSALTSASVDLALCYGPGLAEKLVRNLAARLLKKAIPIVGQIAITKDVYDLAGLLKGAGEALLACSVSASHEHWDVNAPSFQVQAFAYAGSSADSIMLPCSSDCVLDLESASNGPTTVQIVLECSAAGEYSECPVAEFSFHGGTNVSSYDPEAGVQVTFAEAGAHPSAATVWSPDGTEQVVPLPIVLNNCDADGDGTSDTLCDSDVHACVVGTGCAAYELTTLDYDGNIVRVYQPSDSVTVSNYTFASFGLLLGGTPVRVFNTSHQLSSDSQGFAIDYPVSEQDVFVPDYVHTIQDTTNGNIVEFPMSLTVSNAVYRYFAGRTLSFVRRSYDGSTTTPQATVELFDDFTATYRFWEGSLDGDERSHSWDLVFTNQFQRQEDCGERGPPPPSGEIDGTIYLGYVGAFGPEYALLKDGVAYANSFYACEWVFPM